jgi:hypothetical protein
MKQFVRCPLNFFEDERREGKERKVWIQAKEQV